MALRSLTLALLAGMTALSGCSEGGGGYPDAYMLGTYNVPEGYELLDEDSEEWQFAQEFGLESNPGYADVEAFEMGEDEEDGDVPLPKRVYVALYVEEGYEPSEEDLFPPILWSMAAEMESDADADATEADMAADEEAACEDAGVPMYMLRDGRFFAMAMAFDEALADDLEDASNGIQDATGAESLC